MKRISKLVILLGLVIPVMAGCRASYPTGSVEETIKQICEKEYGVDVTVATRNKTVGALIVMPDTLLSDLTFSDQALNKIENVMLTTSRVTLSSEFVFDFFVISLRDADTGVEVSFVRYIKDIRRLIMDDISRSDYFQRLLIEVSAQAPVPKNSRGIHKLKDYSVPDFLAAQIAERVRLKFQMSFISERLFSISGVQGIFDKKDKPGDGLFILTLHFLPDAEPFKSFDVPAAVKEDFKKLIFTTASQVVRRYEFDDFAGMRIQDAQNRQLAYYDRGAFSKTSMNTLMELIRTIKKKDK
ncbi:hypothetical protein K8S19_08240 [bacterium]|nr:hypothetical protein [bacterium]